jgi:excisionase family DNA binding protein
MGKESLTLSVTECAKILGLGRNSTYMAVARGEIPVVRIGKRLLIPKKALERMLQEPKNHNPGQESSN